MSSYFAKELRPKDTPPDIFRAAINNDIAELMDALAEGQSLSERRSVFLNRTPVHVAAGRSSNDFLAVACNHETFDPWLRDDNNRTAFDHADAYANDRGKTLLFDKMYGEPTGPDPRYIDYTDNEPSEFFP